MKDLVVAPHSRVYTSNQWFSTWGSRIPRDSREHFQGYSDAVSFAETFRSFLLRHFGHWNISVVCLTVVLKLTKTVLFCLYFQMFWPKWLNFFRSFQKRFGLWPKNDRKI